MHTFFSELGQSDAARARLPGVSLQNNIYVYIDQKTFMYFKKKVESDYQTFFVKVLKKKHTMPEAYRYAFAITLSLDHSLDLD